MHYFNIQLINEDPSTSQYLNEGEFEGTALCYFEKYQ